MRRSLSYITLAFDGLRRRWEWLTRHHVMGALFVALFLGALATIQLNRLGLLPPGIAAIVGTDHFGAVSLAFTGLLFVEVLSLVFVLAESVAVSVGKQFELFALILLRKAFLAFGAAGDPVAWDRASSHILQVMADIVGALLVFFLLGVYYRLQRHKPITSGPDERASFIAAKEAVALLLLVAFAVLAVVDLRRVVTGSAPWPFFEAFYTVLVFSDILLVLLALGFNSKFATVFRNTGFAAATILLRIALTAPPFINAAVGLGALVVAVGLTLAYNQFPEEPDGEHGAA